ncbi:[SSU ribosomal protein S18P]-alanine acetyltransferase [Streptohalobacillus salinus]|uniref:[Ribosomal protein bS18]-alanine N-acetyltransferase n=1 Tax=Streptohalobacillus salinus TaxID=621096 RepID=A0A2V3VZR2_9BACI|nr:ribosomal protein S18-alanine N-acetyltransferase [Streptohalobacillus salinus]PXW86391.1 [SSU ribosomal protein S18P]-alanine acetyltransferase [Streptohalobacillus salinus]
MSKVAIRLMQTSDLEQVTAIERRSFKTPWDRALYQKEIEENQFAYYYVIEKDNEIIGFCGMWIVLDDAQITNIAIDPDHRKFSYGSTLFQYVLNQAMVKGARTLSLEVRTSNIAAQTLYEKFHLQKAGTRRNYYTDNNEDAIVMWVTLV